MSGLRPSGGRWLGAWSSLWRPSSWISLWALLAALLPLLAPEHSLFAAADGLGLVKFVSSNDKAYVAVFDDGTVRSWGDGNYGGYGYEDFLLGLKNVSQVYGNGMAFAAILGKNNRVVTWGDATSGGDSSSVASLLVGISKIFSTRRAFAALTKYGSVVTWGFGPHGGDSSAVRDSLSSGVSTICSNDVAFLAVKFDGTVVSWPIYNQYGGNSTSVLSQLVDIDGCGRQLGSRSSDSVQETPPVVPRAQASSYPRDCNFVPSSGVYFILPSRQSKPVQVFCDLDTPDGPWMLTYAYKHIGGQDNKPVEGVIPTDPSAGYSHIDVGAIQGFTKEDIAAVRFYCKTSAHNRTVSFYTSNNAVRDIAWGSGANSTMPWDWNSGWTPLSGHSANLPSDTDSTGSTVNFIDSPFAKFNTYRWTVYGNNKVQLPLSTSGYRYYTKAGLLDFSSSASKPLFGKPIGLRTPDVLVPTGAPSSVPGQAAGSKVVLKIDSSVPNLKLAEIIIKNGPIQQFEFSVEASSNEDQAALAVDGNEATSWRSNVRDPFPWIAIDLTGVPFDTILVKPLGFTPKYWSPSELQISIRSDLESPDAYWAATFQKMNRTNTGFYAFNIFPFSSVAPTRSPTLRPTVSLPPNKPPTRFPTLQPSTAPTPSPKPTVRPPTQRPSFSPTAKPTVADPTGQPTSRPSHQWSMIYSYSYSSAEKPNRGRFTVRPTQQATAATAAPSPQRTYLLIDQRNKPGANLSVADISLFSRGARVPGPFAVFAKGCNSSVVQQQAARIFDGDYKTYFSACDSDGWLSLDVTGVVFDKVVVLNRASPLVGYTVAPGGCGMDDALNSFNSFEVCYGTQSSCQAACEAQPSCKAWSFKRSTPSDFCARCELNSVTQASIYSDQWDWLCYRKATGPQVNTTGVASRIIVWATISLTDRPSPGGRTFWSDIFRGPPNPEPHDQCRAFNNQAAPPSFNFSLVDAFSKKFLRFDGFSSSLSTKTFAFTEVELFKGANKVPLYWPQQELFPYGNGLDCSVSRYWSVLKRASPLPQYFPMTSESSLTPSYNYNVDENGPGILIDGSYSSRYSSGLNAFLPWIYMDITGLDFDSIEVSVFSGSSCLPVNSRVSINADPMGGDATKLWASFLGSAVGGSSPNAAMEGFQSLSSNAACPTAYTLYVSGSSSPSPTAGPPTLTRFPTRQPSSAAFVRGKEYFRIEQTRHAPLHIAEVQLLYRGVRLTPAGYPVFASPAFLENSGSPSAALYRPSNAADGNMDTSYLSGQTNQNAFAFLVVETTTRQYDTVVVILSGDANFNDIAGAHASITSDIAGNEVLWSGLFGGSTASSDGRTYTFVLSGSFLSSPPTLTWSPTLRPTSATILPTVSPSVRGRKLLAEEGEEEEQARSDRPRGADRLLFTLASQPDEPDPSKQVPASPYSAAGKQSVALFPGQDFTIQAWVYSQSYSKSPTQKAAIFAVGSLNKGSGILLRVSKVAGVELQINNQFIFGGSSEILENAWQHVTVSRCGGVVRLFINGNKVRGAKRWAMLEAVPRLGVVLGANPDILKERLFGYMSDVDMSLYCEYDENFAVVKKRPAQIPTLSPTPAPPTRVPTPVLTAGPTPSPLVAVPVGVHLKLTSSAPIALTEVKLLYKQRVVPLPATAVQIQARAGHGSSMCTDNDLTTYCKTVGVHEITIYPGQAAFDQVQIFQLSFAADPPTLMLLQENAPNRGVVSTVYTQTFPPSQSQSYTRSSSYIFDLNCPLGSFSPTGTQPCFPCANGLVNFNASSLSCDSSASYCPMHTFMSILGRSPGPTMQLSGNSALCKNCPAGTLTTREGGPCVPVPAGFYASSPINPQVLTCPAGTYSAAGALVCSDCPIGTTSKAGATSCSPTPPGMYYSVAQMRPLPCPLGSYASGYGVLVCTPCWAGSSTLIVGSTTCFPVPAGYFSSLVTAGFVEPFAKRLMVPCPKGTSSPPAASSCTPCAAGFYADTVASAICKPSPASMFPTVRLTTLFSAVPPPLTAFVEKDSNVLLRQNVTFASAVSSPLSPLSGTYQLSASNYSVATEMYPAFAFDNDAATELKLVARFNQNGSYTGTTTTTGLVAPRFSQPYAGSNLDGELPAGWLYNRPIPLVASRLIGRLSLPQKYTLTFSFKLDGTTPYYGVDLFTVACASCAFGSKLGYPRVHFSDSKNFSDRVFSHFSGDNNVTQQGVVPTIPKRAWVTMKVQVDNTAPTPTQVVTLTANKGSLSVMNSTMTYTFQAFSANLGVFLYAGGVFAPTAVLGSIKDITFTDDTVSAPASSSVQGEWLQFRVPGGLVPTSYTFKFNPDLAVTRWSLLASKDETSWLPLGQGGGSPLYPCAYDTIQEDLTAVPYYDASADYSYFRLVIEGARAASRFSDNSILDPLVGKLSIGSNNAIYTASDSSVTKMQFDACRGYLRVGASPPGTTDASLAMHTDLLKISTKMACFNGVCDCVPGYVLSKSAGNVCVAGVKQQLSAPTSGPTPPPTSAPSATDATNAPTVNIFTLPSIDLSSGYWLQINMPLVKPDSALVDIKVREFFVSGYPVVAASSGADSVGNCSAANGFASSPMMQCSSTSKIMLLLDQPVDNKGETPDFPLKIHFQELILYYKGARVPIPSSATVITSDALDTFKTAMSNSSAAYSPAADTRYFDTLSLYLLMDVTNIVFDQVVIWNSDASLLPWNMRVSLVDKNPYPAGPNSFDATTKIYTSRFLDVPAALSYSLDFICPAGSYSSTGVYPCTPCPAGSVAPSSGSTVCTAVAPGNTTAKVPSVLWPKGTGASALIANLPKTLTTPADRRFSATTTSATNTVAWVIETSSAPSSGCALTDPFDGDSSTVLTLPASYFNITGLVVDQDPTLLSSPPFPTNKFTSVASGSFAFGEWIQFKVPFAALLWGLSVDNSAVSFRATGGPTVPVSYLLLGRSPSRSVSAARWTNVSSADCKPGASVFFSLNGANFDEYRLVATKVAPATGVVAPSAATLVSVQFGEISLVLDAPAGIVQYVCPAGTYASYTGTCALCPVGTFSLPGQTSCSTSQPAVAAAQPLVDESLSADGLASLNTVLATRLVMRNYTGPLLRLRRDSDSATADFFATVRGDLGSAFGAGGIALKDWGGSATLYVACWYDQSVGGNHALQSNRTLQPVYSLTDRTVNFTGNAVLNTFTSVFSSRSTSGRARLPTTAPSVAPTLVFNSQPTPEPSPMPTAPTASPTTRTFQFTRSPTAPTAYPSSAPTFVPSRLDGSYSFVVGSHDVPDVALIAPTLLPTGQPSGKPSRSPTGQPSGSPSQQPVLRPTSYPSAQPLSSPTRVPSRQPSRQPSGQPTKQPFGRPSGQPTTIPTNPTGQPSRQPSRQPTRQPTVRPSVPTRAPSYVPSGFPSGLPTGQPSGRPSVRGSSPKRRLLAAVVEEQPKAAAASSRRRLDVSSAGVGISGSVSTLFSTGEASGDVSFGYAPASVTYVKRPSSGPLYLSIDSIQTLASFNFTSALSLAEITLFNGAQKLNITSSMVNVTLDQNPYYSRMPLSPGLSGAALVDNNRSSVFSMFNVSVRILVNTTQLDRISVVNTVDDCSYTTLEKLVYPGVKLSGAPATYSPSISNTYTMNIGGVPITGSPTTYGAGQYIVKASYDASNMGVEYATSLPTSLDWLSEDTTSALRAFDGSKLTYWTFTGTQSISITLPDSIVPIGFTITSHPNPDRNPASVTIRGNNDGSNGGVDLPCTTCANIEWTSMTYGWGRSVKGFSSFNFSIPQEAGQASYSTFRFEFSAASGPVTSIGDIKVYALVPTKQYRPAAACRTRIANARISLSKSSDGSQPFWSERFDDKGALEYSFTPFTFKRYLRIQGLAGIKGDLKSNWFKYETDPLAVGDIQLFYKGQLLQNITAPFTSSNAVDPPSGPSSPLNLLDGNASTYWSTNTVGLPFVSIDVSGRVFDKIIVNNPAGQYNALGNFHISITDDPNGMFPYWNASFTPGFVRAYEFDGPFPLFDELPQKYETRWKSDVATLPSAVYVVYLADQRTSASAPLVIPSRTSFSIEAIGGVDPQSTAGLFTMEAWVKGVPWGVKAGIIRFMDSTSDTPGTQFSLLIYNGIQFIRRVNSVMTSVMGGQPSSDLPAGQIGPVGLWFNSTNVNYTSSDWIHIALVRYSATFALYWNGTLLDSNIDEENRYQASFTPGPISLGAATDEKGNMVGFQGIISDFVFTKGIPYNTSGFTPPPPGWTSNRSFVNGPVTKSKLQGDSFFAQTFNPATDVLSSYVNSGEALVLTTPSKVDINSIATAIGSNSNMTIYSFITASSELSSADVKVLGAIKSSPAVTVQAASKVFLRIDQRSRPGVVSGISVTKVTLIKNGVVVPFAASTVFSKQQACSDANPANLASGSGVFIVCNPTDPWLYVDVTGLSFDSFNVSTRSDSAWQQYQCRSSDIYCTPEYVRTAISMYNNVTGTYLGSSNTLTAAQCMASCDKIPGCTGIDFSDDGTLKHCFWNNFPLSEVVYLRSPLYGSSFSLEPRRYSTKRGNFPYQLYWWSTYPYYKSNDTSTLSFATVSLTNVTDGSYAYWQDALTIKSGLTNTFSFKVPTVLSPAADLFLTACPAGAFSEAGECVPCPSSTFKDVGALSCRGLGLDQFGAATSSQLFSIPPAYKSAVTAVAPGPFVVSQPSTLVVDYPSVAAPEAFTALKEVLVFNGNFETTVNDPTSRYIENCSPASCFAGWKGTGKVIRLAIGTIKNHGIGTMCSGSVPCHLNTLSRQGNWTAGLSGKFASLSTAITLPGDVDALVVSLVGNYLSEYGFLPYGPLAGGLDVGVFLADPAASFVSGDLSTYGMWLGNVTIVGTWRAYECGSDVDVSAYAGRTMTLRLVLLTSTEGTALVDAVSVSYVVSPETAQAVAAKVVENIRVPFSNSGFDDLPLSGVHFKGIALTLGGTFNDGDWVGSSVHLATMPEMPGPGFWWDQDVPEVQCWSAPGTGPSQSCAIGLAPWQTYSQFKTEPNQYSYFVALRNVGATLDKLFTFHPQVTTVSLSFVANFNPAMGSWAIPNKGGGVVGIYLHNFETNAAILLGQRTITGPDSPPLAPAGAATSGWSTYSFTFDATQFRGLTTALRLRFDGGCSNNMGSNNMGDCYISLDNVQATYRTTWSWKRPSPAPSPTVLLGGTYNFSVSSALNFASNVAYAVDDNFDTSAAFAVDTYQSQAPFTYRGGAKGVTTVKYSLHCLRGPIKESTNACAVRPFPVSGEWIQMVVPTRVHPSAVSINTPPSHRVLEFVVLGSSDGVNWVLMSKRGDVSRTASMPLKWDAFGYDKWFAPKFLRVVVTAAQVPLGQGLRIAEFSIFGYPSIVARTGADGAFKCATGRVLQQSDWSCVPCPLGTIYTALNVTCTPCPAGTFSGGALGSTACTLCPLGTSSSAGSAKCAMCPPGQYSNYPGGPCVSIPAGFFPSYSVKLPSVSLLSLPLDSRQTAAATSVNTGGIFPGRGVYHVTVSQPPSGRTYSVAERQAALSMLDLNPSTAFRLSTTNLYNHPGAYVGSTTTTYQTPQGLAATVAGEYVEVRIPSRLVLNELSLAVVDSYSSRYVVEWVLLGALSTAGQTWTEVEHYNFAAAANETWNTNSQYVRPSFYDRFRLVIVRINDVAVRYVGPDGVSRPPNPAMKDVLISELSFVGDLELESVLSPWKWNARVVEPLQCPSGFASVAGSTQCSLFVPRHSAVLVSVGQVQNVTVPAGMNMMLVKLWGAGGAGSSVDIGTVESATFGYGGGAGAYAQCYIPVTPGETLQVIVGGGGYTSAYSDSANTTYLQAGGFGGGGNASIKSNPFLSYGQVAAVGSGGGMTAIRRLIRPQTAVDVAIWDYAVIAAGGGGAGIGNSTTPAAGGGGLASYATYNMKYSPAYSTSVDFEPIRKYVFGGSGRLASPTARWGGGAGGGAGYPGGRVLGSASKYTIGNGLGGVSFLGPETVGCIRTTALSFSGKSGSTPTSPTAATPAPSSADADYRASAGSGGAFMTRPSPDRRDPTFARGGDGLAVLIFSGIVPKYTPRRLLSTSFSSSSSSSSSSTDAPFVELEAGMSYAEHVEAAAAGSAQRRFLSSSSTSFTSGEAESEMTMHFRLTEGEPLTAEDEQLLAAQATLPTVGSDHTAEAEAAAAQGHTQRKLSRSSQPLDGSKWETPPSPKPVSRSPTARPSRRLDLPGRAPHAKYFSMYSGFSIVYSMAARRTNYPTRPLGDLKNVMKQAKLTPREQVASRFECDNVLYGPQAYKADSLHQVWVRMADTQTRWPTQSPAAPQRQKRVPTTLPTLRPTTQGATSVPSSSVPTSHPTSGINGQFKPTVRPSAAPTSPTGQPSSEPTSTRFMQQFSFAGGAVNFTVPAGVSSIWVDAYGAQGGSGTAQAGGKGAYVRALLSVTPGQVLSVTVGGPGGDAFYNPTNAYGTFTSDGGFNGGGSGAFYPQAADDSGISSLFGGGGGGGSSDVRPFGTDQKRRLVVAGGGGGALILQDQAMEFFGGPGGGAVGGSGGSGRQGTSPQAIALGATQSVGGTNALVAPDGSCSASCGNPAGKPSRSTLAGRFWLGGSYTSTKLNNPCSGGGGGSGYYGGGAGCLSGGGGGSSFTTGTLLQWSNGVRAGAGFVTITWSRVPTAAPTPSPSIVPSPAPSAVPSAAPTNKYLYMSPPPTRMSYTGSFIVVDYYTPPANTQVGQFYGIFVDDAGRIYGTYCSPGTGDKRVFRLTPTTTTPSITWSPTQIIAPGTYNCPAGITVLPNGDIYLGIQFTTNSYGGQSIFKIPAGTSLPTATTGSGFQPVVEAISCPSNIVFDSTYSTMYIPDACHGKIWTVDMATLAATYTIIPNIHTYSIALDDQGAIYIASPVPRGSSNRGVYKIANPKVSMVAVQLAHINTPQSDPSIGAICIDRVANVVYAIDSKYDNIYKVNPTTGDYVLIATWTGRNSNHCFVDRGGYVYVSSNTTGIVGRLEPASSLALPLSDATMLWHYRFEAGDITGTSLVNRAAGGAATVQGSAQVVATGSPSRYGGGYLNIATLSQHLQLPSITVTASSVFTLTFWMKPSSSWTRRPMWPQLFVMLTTTAYQSGFLFSVEGNSFVDELYVANQGLHDYTGPSITSYITGQQWLHLALVFGAAVKPTLYVNGVFVNTFSTTSFVVAQTYTNVFFGTCPWEPTGHHFYGGIDDLMLFSRQLTNNEIAALSAFA